MTTRASLAQRVSMHDQVLAVLEDAVVPMTAAQIGKRVVWLSMSASGDHVQPRSYGRSPAVSRELRHLEEAGRVTRRQPERKVFWELASGERDARAAVRASLAALAERAGRVDQV